MKLEIIEKLAALLTFSFGLVAALAWKTTIQTIFKTVFGDAENIQQLLIYAIVVTTIAVIVIILIARVKANAVSSEAKK